MVRWGISHFFTATRNTIEGVGEKEQTNTIDLVSSKCKKGSFVTLHSLCICRLTLACILRKISTKLLGMPTHLWLSSSLLLNSSPHRLLSSAVRCQLPLCVSLRQLTSLGSFTNSLSGFSQTCLSSPTSGLVGDLESKPFVWFCAKIDKGIVCLVDHPHSVTASL